MHLRGGICVSLLRLTNESRAVTLLNCLGYIGKMSENAYTVIAAGVLLLLTVNKI